MHLDGTRTLESRVVNASETSPRVTNVRYADLGVTKTHSRPHVSNDNPFSEAGFKTLEYRPDFPERFGCAHIAASLQVGGGRGTTSPRSP